MMSSATSKGLSHENSKLSNLPATNCKTSTDGLCYRRSRDSSMQTRFITFSIRSLLLMVS